MLEYVHLCSLLFIFYCPEFLKGFPFPLQRLASDANGGAVAVFYSIRLLIYQSVPAPNPESLFNFLIELSDHVNPHNPTIFLPLFFLNHQNTGIQPTQTHKQKVA
jgi:hypothetical protein